jgi:hypothetical protein
MTSVVDKVAGREARSFARAARWLARQVLAERERWLLCPGVSAFFLPGMCLKIRFCSMCYRAFLRL